MCLYYKCHGKEMILVGVYVDDRLVTASKLSLVNAFFASMRVSSMKDLGEVRKFLGMRVDLGESKGCSLDQQMTIKALLEQHGLACANGVQVPIGEESNDAEAREPELLTRTGAPVVQTVRSFHSLVGSSVDCTLHTT